MDKKEQLKALRNLVSLMKKDRPLPIDLQQTFDEIHNYILETEKKG